MKGPDFFLKGPTAQSKQGIYQARAIGTSLLLSFVINELHFLSLLLNADQDQELSQSCKKRALNFTTTLLGYCILAHFFYERLSSREHHFLRRAGSAFSRFVILTRTTWFPSFDINSLPGGLTMRCATCTNAFPMMRVETVQNTNDDDHGIKKRRLWLHFRCIFSHLVKVLHVQLQFLWYLVM